METKRRERTYYKVYISKTFDNYPEGLVFAKSYNVALAFFHGRGYTVNSIEQFDLSAGGVFDNIPCIEIIETEEIRPSEVFYRERSYRVIKKRGK